MNELTANKLTTTQEQFIINTAGNITSALMQNLSDELRSFDADENMTSVEKAQARHKSIGFYLSVTGIVVLITCCATGNLPVKSLRV